MQAEVLIETRNMSREEWLKWRRKGIGGSDAAAVAGLNPWKSPVEVWLEKTGQTTPEEDNERMYWGRKLEDLVAEKFAEETGLKVWRRNAILQHPEYPFMIANIDRRIVGADEGLECKTTSEYNKDEWQGDNIPDMYQIQCQHYMAVTGYKAWWIAVLIGGNKFRYKKIERDEDVIQYLIKIEADFWKLVEKEIPPEPDGSNACTNLIKKMYPEADPDKQIILPDDYRDLIQLRNSYKEQIKELETKLNEVENKIKNKLGDAEVGLIDGEPVVTWKNFSSTRFNTRSFKKDHPDLYEKYAYKSTYRRFDVR